MTQQQIKHYKNFQILIVDNDASCRGEIADHLLQMGFPVLMTETADKAKEILKNEKVDLVLTEMQMPNESGIELIHWVRRIYDTSFRKHMPQPCILMTGFTHLIKDEDLSDLNLNACISKPINLEELTEEILIALQIKEREVKGLSDETAIDDFTPYEKDYCQVLISDFNVQPALEMDLYIQLTSKKFIRIGKQGERLANVQLRRYQEKGIKHLFIHRSDFQKVVDFNAKLNKAVAASDQLSLEKKQRFLVKTGEVIMENTFVNGISQETFDDAKDYLISSLNTFIKDDETFELLDALNDHGNYLYAHSLGVSIYSVMIAQRLGWSSGGNLLKLSLGALLHDIGKKDFDPELLDKPKSDLTFEEKALLETHPERGKKILEGIKTIPSEVAMIAYEHHENAIGKGYPRRIKKNRISPMARIVNVADEFCYYAIKNPDFPVGDAKKALHMLDRYKHQLVDHDSLMALRLIIKQKDRKKKIS